MYKSRLTVHVCALNYVYSMPLTQHSTLRFSFSCFKGIQLCNVQFSWQVFRIENRKAIWNWWLDCSIIFIIAIASQKHLSFLHCTDRNGFEKITCGRKCVCPSNVFLKRNYPCSSCKMMSKVTYFIWQVKLLLNIQISEKNTCRKKLFFFLIPRENYLPMAIFSKSFWTLKC